VRTIVRLLGAENLPRAFWYVWWGSLINRLGTFVVPYMAFYLTGERHLDMVTVGRIVSCFGLGSILSATISGVLSDLWGRKRTMVLSLTLGPLAMIHLSIAERPGHVAIAALLLGLAGDLYYPARNAMVTDLVPEDRRAAAFGLVYWCANLGFSVAIAVAGVVAARSGFTTLFYLDACTTLAFAAITLIKVPETRPSPALAIDPTVPVGGAADGDAATPYRDAWPRTERARLPYTDLSFLLFVASNFVVSTVFQQGMVAMPLDLRERGVSTQTFGLLMSMNGVLIVLLQPWVARFKERPVLTRPIALGTVLTGLGFGALPLASNVPWFALTIVVWTFGELLLAPSTPNVISRLAHTSTRGQYQGLFMMSHSASACLAPLIGPWLLSRFGNVALWSSCFAATLVAALAQEGLGRFWNAAGRWSVARERG
jgi:MFS family permease